MDSDFIRSKAQEPMDSQISDRLTEGERGLAIEENQSCAGRSASHRSDCACDSGRARCCRQAALSQRYLELAFTNAREGSDCSWLQCV